MWEERDEFVAFWVGLKPHAFLILLTTVNLILILYISNYCSISLKISLNYLIMLKWREEVECLELIIWKDDRKFYKVVPCYKNLTATWDSKEFKAY